MTADDIFGPLPEEEIPVNQKIVWADNGNPLSFRHIRDLLDHPDKSPIWVEQVISGHYFVHNGRHRVMRAFLDGRETINAKVLRHS